MDTFDAALCEFGLSIVEGAQIRRIVAALGLDLRDPAVLESVRSALRVGGMAAFTMDFRCELWGLRLIFDPGTSHVDMERATEALCVKLKVDRVEWTQLPGCGGILAEFSFRAPEAWPGVLVSALAGVIRRRVLDLVGHATATIGDRGRCI